MNKFLAKIAGVALGLAMAIGVGVSVSSGDARGVRAGTSVEYKLTLDSDSITAEGSASSGYGKYNGTRTLTAYGTSDNTLKYDVEITTYQVMPQSSKIQFQASAGKLYNSTSMGSISSVSANNDDLTVIIGSSEDPSSSTSGGSYFVVKKTNKGAAQTLKIEIVFTVSTYTVTFNANGHGTAPSSVTVGGGSKVTAPTAPTATGYTFGGWYKEESCINAWVFNTDTVSADTELYAKWTANQYDINYYDKGGADFSGTHETGYPTKHTYDTSTTLKSAAKAGYSFDGWFTNTDCTGDAVTSLGATTYTAAINLYAKWTLTATIYTITVTIADNHGTSTGDSTITSDGGTASITVSPTGDYKLPTSVSVSGADYEYNSTTGVISLSNATANVTISVTMVALTEYTITVNETDGSHTGDIIIKESRTASLTFTPDSGFAQPDSVTVTGATFTWTKGTGVLSLSNPTANVVVTYTAKGNELDSITLSTNSGSYTLGDAFVKPTVTAHFTVAADEDVTNSENLTVTGYDPYTSGNQTVTISYTEGGITKTASYIATVGAFVPSTSYNKITSISDLVEGDYIMAYSTKAFNSTDANDGYTSVSITNNSISGSAAMDKLALHITPVTGGYTFQVSSTSDNNAGKYLGFSSGNNSLSFNDNAVTIASQTVSSSTHTTHSSGGAFTFGDSSTVLSWNDVSNAQRFRFYKTSTTSDSKNGTSYYAIDLYKKVSSGTGSLIRITASYGGNAKYIGDTLSASDFTVKKQLNTSDTLIDVTSGFTLSASTLTSTSNIIRVSYTEGNITKTADVEIAAEERTATVSSVTLVQGENVKKNYIDWSGTAWDYTDLTVHCVWTDTTYNEDLSLADLVTVGDATVSPAKPAVGITSFTVTYTYHEIKMTDNVVSDITVVADYITSISWTGTTASHFKAFSGGQLTAEQVGAWSVVPTWKGAGEGSALSFNDYTLKVGTKTISELPYTWQTEDDGKELSITYGKDVDGNDFVKKNGTAVGNICATINTISHDESSIEERTISNMITNAVYTTGKTGTSGTGSDTEFTDANGLVKFNSDKGYKQSDTQLRVYAGGTYEVTSEYKIKTITFTVSSGYEGGLTNGSAITVNSKSWNSSNTTTKQARITGIAVVIDYEGVDTVVYSNKDDYFDEQKAVVEFATYLNEQMNATNACNGTFEELSTQWALVATKYDALFGTGTALDATELEYAKKMLKYADAKWGGETEADCVERAMKTYDICVSVHGLTPFMFETGSDTPLRSINTVNGIGGLNILNDNSGMIIIIISVVSLASIGGFFFLRKRKEY